MCHECTTVWRWCHVCALSSRQLLLCGCFSNGDIILAREGIASEEVGQLHHKPRRVCVKWPFGQGRETRRKRERPLAAGYWRATSEVVFYLDGAQAEIIFATFVKWELLEGPSWGVNNKSTGYRVCRPNRILKNNPAIVEVACTLWTGLYKRKNVGLRNKYTMPQVKQSK